MGLAEYGRKRHFNKTSEPVPQKSAKTGWSYVIQKHDASHLHYDFRLELDGVLKSWAVPKGPSLDPTVKRLAIEVEDHPVDYGSFEGIIPQGEYGGGTVLLWDRGYWEPTENAREGLRKGRLKFQLHGEKLRGGWSLVRTNRPEASKPQWLLIKERDDECRPAAKSDVLTEMPLSVATGRDLQEISKSEASVWSSLKKPATKKSAALSATQKGRKGPRAESNGRSNTKKQRSPMPNKIDVQLATLVNRAPEGDEWLHEIKFDGYRMICRIDGSRVKFITRNHNDWTRKLTELVVAARELPCQNAILDGEIVVLQANGTTDFQSLQNAFREQRTRELKYYVFDLLYLNGSDLSQLPLEQRKSALERLLPKAADHQAIRFSDHVVGHGEDFNQQACRLHLEGSVSKRRDQPYKAGRGSDWLKVKCVHDEEFVIGGFTNPTGARSGFGALLVGFFDEAGDLHYAGKVGTGFGAIELTQLHSRLKSLERKTSPFLDLTSEKGVGRGIHWVEPSLVGQFKYGSRTKENRLRHAAFQGWREDKAATEVKMEVPVSVKKVNPKTSVIDAKQTSSKPPAKKQKTDGQTKAAPATGKDRKRRQATTYNADSETFFGQRLTHPKKIVFPDAGITKLDLANYYYEAADWILPYLSHRPIVLVRCPGGATKKCFYQKHPGVGTPEALRQIPIEESDKTENYLIVDNVEGLIGLAQLGALEIHTWGSREDNLETPDQLVFDLDPDPRVSWDRVIDSAQQIRRFLQQLGLESYVKTTGGKGLHLFVPINRRYEWADVKAFCKQVAELIVVADPSRYTTNLLKAARTNKIFIDYLRNGRGATAVAPYSTRARPNASVSMPLAWEELTSKMTSDHFTIKNAMTRLKGLKRDPWFGFQSDRQSLTGPLKKLESLAKDTIPKRGSAKQPHRRVSTKSD